MPGYSPTGFTAGTPVFGTLQTQDTLQSLRVFQGTIATYGESDAWEIVNLGFIAHNKLLAMLLEPFCEVTTNRLRQVGGMDQMEMEEIDEYGDTQPQKIETGANIGFPLRKYGASLQWTRDYFQNIQAQEFAAQVTALLTADLRRLQRQIKRAFFNSVNYTFYDRIIDNVTLPIKALQNNDPNYPIPVGPNGEIFPSTMNHYHVANSVSPTSISALKLEVTEHNNQGQAYFLINQVQENAFRALPNNYFVPLLSTEIVGAIIQPQAPGMKLNPVSPYDRLIGYYEGCEVWVKPWIPVGYILCYQTAERKPIAFRVRGTGVEGIGGTANSIIGGSVGIGNGDLQLVYEYDEYPLRCRGYKREFDCSIQNRIGAAVLQLTNASSYTSPIII